MFIRRLEITIGREDKYVGGLAQSIIGGRLTRRTRNPHVEPGIQAEYVSLRNIEKIRQE